MQQLGASVEARDAMASSGPAQPLPSPGPNLVPDLPSLMPNVQLVGRLQDSGFKAEHWLLQRNGRFIQVTELLYRVAEQCNGRQTPAEIAQTLTDVTDWAVTEDAVRLILRTKLIPLGIVTSNQAPQVAGAGSGQTRPRSPLAVNARMKVFGPRLIEPITARLQFLYAPPLLIPILVCIGIAHWWLYRVHGLNQSIIDLMYAPGLMLALAGMMILAAVFHEFGHASALRYGHGSVRAMGVGLYLVYPVFYTDTTDSYRLGRWARVRTDLGGFYFHLVFTLLIIGLYYFTHWEFVLLAIPVINLDILRQLIPFVRLDGYWALTDLVGIPDLFSQTGALLRRLLPNGSKNNMKLPDMKSWARLVFAIYVLATVPLLGLLLFLTIKGLPTILSMLLSGLQFQGDVLINASREHRPVMMVLAALQMALLAIPMVGIPLLLFNLSRVPLRLIWLWSMPRQDRSRISALGRPLVAGMLGIGAIGVLALLWRPQLQPVRGPEPPGVQTFAVGERLHVPVAVSYAQSPPVGGDHAPIWQNCGFYASPVANENAVHALEHGAVWITYRLDLPQSEIEELRGFAPKGSYILVSPYPDQDAPVVASAWGKQLRLDSIDDPRLEQFIAAYQGGMQAPERGGACTGGVGTPDN